MARARFAVARRGLGLRLRQRPGERARSPNTSRVVHATDVAARTDRRRQAASARALLSRAGRALGSRDAVVDLVTVAQALHWFDVEAFYAEARARRAARARCWRSGTTRGRNSWTPELDRRFFDVLFATWSGRTGHRSAGTSKPDYTHAAVSRSRKSQRRQFGLELDWNLEQVLGLREQLVRDRALSQGAAARIPCRCCASRCSAAWPGEGASVPLRMPLGLRVAKVAAAE